MDEILQDKDQLKNIEKMIEMQKLEDEAAKDSNH